MTAPNVEADVVWLVEHEDVCTIWRATREVFGNSMWHSDVDEALDVDKYREYVDLVEERSEQSLFDCVLDAVSGMYPGDPSEVFAAMHRQFATYGVDLQFEAHYRYGDLLARAATLVSGGSITEPQQMYALGEEEVVNIWDEAVNRGYDRFRPDRWYDSDLRDDLSATVGGEAFLTTSMLVEGFDENSDPSLFFRNLSRYCAEHGIALTIAAHPTYGDVLARAAALSS